jgi:uncharacterized protein
MKEYSIDFDLTEAFGVELISVPPGEVIEVDLRLESVTEGVLATADVFATAMGECIRCLDPIAIDIDRSFQELYRYEVHHEKGSKGSKKRRPSEDVIDDLDVDDELLMQGDYIDLETPLRDAIVLALPVNPLCSEDCLGLCQQCGEKWADLPEGHAHEQIDPRWAALGSLEADKDQ